MKKFINRALKTIVGLGGIAIGIEAIAYGVECISSLFENKKKEGE